MDVSLCLFRVLQEALGNALKHSKVRRYEVELFEQTDTIHLVVRDVGVGFNAGAALTGRGLGLISMQERIKLVKGQISFDSRPQRGTTIRAMVQLDSGSNMAGLQRYKHRLLQLLRWHDNFVLTDSDGKLIKVCTRPRNRA